MALRNAKGLLNDLKAKIKHIKDNNEQLTSKFSATNKEKSDMLYKFEEAAKALRSKSNFKNDVLEQKLIVF